MPTLAGWLTGEQVPQEIIEQTLTAMGEALSQRAGQPGHNIQPGAGLIAFSDTAFALPQSHEPPVLDWSPDRRTLVYRRPLSGLHPLYYIENWPAEGNLLFASEIKALLAVGTPRRLHLAALEALRHYGFIPAPWTAFKDIYVVPAGSILRWQRTKTIVNHATDYRFDEASSQTIGQIETLLRAATERLLPSHEQLVALTGGGQASTLSTLLAAHQTTVPFPIAAASYAASLTAQDWKCVEQIAAAARRPLLAISGIDQPEFWTATLAATEAPSIDTRPLAWHQLLHTTSVETDARVAISGLGAHILVKMTSGNPNQSDSPSGEPSSSLTTSYIDMLASSAGPSVRKLWSQDAAALLSKEERWEDTLHARRLTRRAEQFPDRRQSYHYLDLHLRLPDRLVAPVEQLAVQERMVVRSPFLQTPVIDILTRLPTFLEDGMQREMLLTTLAQRYLTDMAEKPATLPLIAPARSLSQVDGSELLQQTLSRASLQATGIFDVQGVEALIQQGANGQIAQELVLVFTTQLWCQLFGVVM